MPHGAKKDVRKSQNMATFMLQCASLGKVRWEDALPLQCPHELGRI